MRRVNITKQNIIKPKAFFGGLTLRQIITMGIGLAVALGIFALLYFVLNIGVDLALFPVFFIIMIFAAGSVMQINGTSALKWMLTILKGNISRPYVSKGVKDRYEEE